MMFCRCASSAILAAMVVRSTVPNAGGDVVVILTRFTGGSQIGAAFSDVLTPMAPERVADGNDVAAAASGSDVFASMGADTNVDELDEDVLDRHVSA